MSDVGGPSGLGFVVEKVDGRWELVSDSGVRRSASDAEVALWEAAGKRRSGFRIGLGEGLMVLGLILVVRAFWSAFVCGC